jgi:hypothetical protein
MTLIIFNPGKSRKALSFDLSVIATLQIAALLYGMSVVFHARPAFIVFSRDSFDLVTANRLNDADLAKAKYPDYRSPPLTGPVYVYSEMPADTRERNEVVLSSFSGKDLPLYPQYYQPYKEHMAAAGHAARSIGTLRKLNPDHIAEIDEAVRRSGRAETDLGYLPLNAKYRNLAILVGISDGKVLKMLVMRPW